MTNDDQRPSLVAAPVIFWAIVLGALALRLFLALTHDNYWGVDGGAYLIGMNAVLGDEPTGAGFPRPPLAPGWLLVPFVQVFDADVGYKVWSALAATLPIFPVYLITRRILGRGPGLFAAGFVALDMLHAEMFVTGALPLIGFTLIALGVYALMQLREGFGWGWWWLLAASVALTPYVNQTSAGLIVIALPVAFAGLMVFGPSSNRQRPARFLLFASSAGLLGGLIALGALPWYMDIAPGSSILHYPGPWLYFVGWPESAWFQFAIAAPVAYWCIRYGQDYRIRTLGLLVAVFGTLLLFLSADETIINVFYRSRYILAMFIYPALAWIVFRYWWHEFRPAHAFALMALAAGLVGWEYVNSVHGQARYSDMVTVQTADALDYLRDEAPGEGVITNAFTLSLWVSGMNKVSTPHVWTWEPPRAYTETDKDVRCVIGWVAGCVWRESALRLGVSHVLVDTRFPDYNNRAPGNYGAPPGQWDVTGSTPWLELVYDKGTTKLWRIADG